jgi:hypothetical protein
MTIIFDSDKDVIVYALEKSISFARTNQYIFLAQSVWWISSIIGLQEGLVIFIDSLTIRSNIGNPEVGTVSSEQQPSSTVPPSRVAQIYTSDRDYIQSDSESIITTETDIHHEVIDNCEAFLEQSKQERKAVGRFTQQPSRVVKQRAKKKKPIKTFGTQTEGIDGEELHRRKAAGECRRCAWPRERKGSHKTLDCFRWKHLEKGTAPFPKNKQYNKD